MMLNIGFLIAKANDLNYFFQLELLTGLNGLLWKCMQKMAEGTGKSSLKSVYETLLQLKQQHGKYCKFRKRQTYTYYFISTSSSHVIACLAVRHSGSKSYPVFIPNILQSSNFALLFCFAFQKTYQMIVTKNYE